MKRLILWAALMLASSPVFSAPLGNTVRTVIPKEVQQIICVDYTTMRNSATATALKQRVLPENLQQLETALRGVGFDENQIETLTFASFRTDKNGLQVVGVAQGPFPYAKIMQRMKLKKIKAAMYRDNAIYPMSNGMQMSFPDEGTLLFGERNALNAALDARDGLTENVNYNASVSDNINSVGGGTVWSVLDQAGTQNMMHSALGDAASLGDYETVKKRLLGSRYAMDFSNGVTFDLSVVTSDNLTAMTMSSLLKAGMLYKKMTASSTEQAALQSVSVDSDNALLKIRFKTDDKQFQALLSSDLFAAVSR